MIISAVLSKPIKECAQILDRPYLRIKIRMNTASTGTAYTAEYFTDKQVFHKHMTEEELSLFLEKHAGKTFRSCIERTESEEITIIANKRGEITTLRKKLSSEQGQNAAGSVNYTPVTESCTASLNRVKNYLLPEGIPVPFLVLLGIMTPDGKVIASKYGKFRQINRFLEFIDDILPRVIKSIKNDSGTRPLRIADFGCGKSYLTFAVHYFVTEIKKIDAEIIGLDLKKDVIEFCNKTAHKLNCRGLRFDTGSIADYSYKNEPDIVITLHACDTATDFALDYAVKHNCRAILSVPCCQHEINGQLDRNLKSASTDGKNTALNIKDRAFAPLLKYGIIKERFAALVTDALRAEYLENAGYSVQLLEFIDMEHTPKNILIRAVKNSRNQETGKNKNGNLKAKEEADALASALGVNPMLKNLLEG